MLGHIQQTALGILLLLTTLVCAASPDPQPAQSLFEKGNTAYAEAAYEDAIAAYEGVLNRGRQSASLYFNLANAHAQLEQYGKAILYYERALHLDPTNGKYRLHLEEVRERAFARAPATFPGENLAFLFAWNTWTGIAVLSFWLGVLLFVIPPLFINRRFYGLSAACLILTALAALALWQYHRESQRGVVIIPSAELKVAPTSASPQVATLPEGLELQFTRQERDHYYILAPDTSRAGWVHQSAFLPLLP